MILEWQSKCSQIDEHEYEVGKHEYIIDTQVEGCDGIRLGYISHVSSV